MKLRPGGGIITSLVQVKGSIRPESAAAMVAAVAALLVGASAFAAAPASTCAGTPVSATHEALAAPTNNSRREILFSIIALTPRGPRRSPPERRALYTVSSRPAPGRDDPAESRTGFLRVPSAPCSERMNRPRPGERFAAVPVPLRNETFFPSFHRDSLACDAARATTRTTANGAFVRPHSACAQFFRFPHSSFCGFSVLVELR